MQKSDEEKEEAAANIQANLPLNQGSCEVGGRVSESDGAEAGLEWPRLRSG